MSSDLRRARAARDRVFFTEAFALLLDQGRIVDCGKAYRPHTAEPVEQGWKTIGFTDGGLVQQGKQTLFQQYQQQDERR